MFELNFADYIDILSGFLAFVAISYVFYIRADYFAYNIKAADTFEIFCM